PFQLILLLLERPGEIVTRDEVRQALWPADTFVDFDHSLGTAVAKLRAALGDSARNPRFVETVANRGYKFIAPVTVTEAVSGEAARTVVVPPLDAAPPEAAVPAEPTRIRWLAATAAAGLLAGGLLLAI